MLLLDFPVHISLFIILFLSIMVPTIDVAICGALVGCTIFDRVVDFGADRSSRAFSGVPYQGG